MIFFLGKTSSTPVQRHVVVVIPIVYRYIIDDRNTIIIQHYYGEFD